MSKINFHQVTLDGKLKPVNPKLLTQKNLTKKGKGGITPLHWAAYLGTLNQIPKKLLTEENLLITDDNEQTPLHKAALQGYLHQIPELLTEDNLLTKDNCDNTPLEGAAKYNFLDQIPYTILLKNKKLCLGNTSEENYERALQETKKVFIKKLKEKIPQIINTKNIQQK
jgi:ankyrin repeat protein